MKQNLNIEAANSPENNFSKLGANRLDYFITGSYTGMALLKKNGTLEELTRQSFTQWKANPVVLVK